MVPEVGSGHVKKFMNLMVKDEVVLLGRSPA
jgi:hypothetical protein